MTSTMDLAILDGNCIRIKGKQSSLIVDPNEKTPKTPADAILLLSKNGATERIEDFRLVVDDDGEYEVGGIKITGTTVPDSGIFYNLSVDNTQVILTKTSTIGNLSDTSSEAQVVLLNVDSALNEALIASLEAKYIVLYGEKASEGLKVLGKQDLAPTRKISMGKEKLPEDTETQIVWLD